MSEIVYAKIAVEDAPQVIEYLYQVWAETPYLTRGANDHIITLDKEQQMLQDIREHPRQEMWKASQGDELVGLLSLYPFEQMRLQHRAGLGLSVKQAYWGQHIASNLMELAITHAQQKDIACIELEVSKENHAGIALYKKFGFKTFGEYDKYMVIDGAYVGAYYMYKDIRKEEG